MWPATQTLCQSALDAQSVMVPGLHVRPPPPLDYLGEWMASSRSPHNTKLAAQAPLEIAALGMLSLQAPPISMGTCELRLHQPRDRCGWMLIASYNIKAFTQQRAARLHKTPLGQAGL